MNDEVMSRPSLPVPPYDPPDQARADLLRASVALGPGPSVPWDHVSDARVLRDLAIETGAAATAAAAARHVLSVLDRDRYYSVHDAEAMAAEIAGRLWPLVAEHLDLAEEYLQDGGPAGRTAVMLQILGAFPEVPSPLEARLTELALGVTRHRRAARALLAGRPDVWRLVERMVREGTTAARASAAEWLGARGRAGTDDTLRAAVAEEQDGVVRAVLLWADLWADHEARDAFPLELVPPSRWEKDDPGVPEELARWLPPALHTPATGGEDEQPAVDGTGESGAARFLPSPPSALTAALGVLDRLRELGGELGLPSAEIERWIAAARPCARLSTHGDGPVVGHLGGLPPEDVSHPDGQFIAAVDLARIPPGAAGLPLPEDGTLLLFARIEMVGTGDWSGGLSTGEAVYVPAGVAVEERVDPSPPEPDSLEGRVVQDLARSGPLRLHTSVELPDPRAFVPSWDEEDETWEALDEELGTLRGHHLQLGGYGRGEEGHETAGAGPAAALAEKKGVRASGRPSPPEDWRLLAEWAPGFSGFEGAGVFWMITREDLAVRRLDRGYAVESFNP